MASTEGVLSKCSVTIFHEAGWIGKTLGAKEALNDLWGHSELTNCLLKVTNVFAAVFVQVTWTSWRC